MLILASQSPRRKMLMEEDISSSFKIIVSHIDEAKSYQLPTPLEAVRDIAKRKGEGIHQLYPHDTVISADTIVVLDNQIIGKPKNEKDAERILHLLSDRTHIVITAYAIFKDDKLIVNHVISEVTFNKLSDKLIHDYVLTGSPMDKAGAYGVQDSDTWHTMKSVKGSLKNVIGFPTDEIKEDLKKMN